MNSGESGGQPPRRAMRLGGAASIDGPRHEFETHNVSCAAGAHGLRASRRGAGADRRPEGQALRDACRDRGLLSDPARGGLGRSEHDRPGRPAGLPKGGLTTMASGPWRNSCSTSAYRFRRGHSRSRTLTCLNCWQAVCCKLALFKRRTHAVLAWDKLRMDERQDQLRNRRSCPHCRRAAVRRRAVCRWSTSGCQRPSLCAARLRRPRASCLIPLSP